MKILLSLLTVGVSCLGLAASADAAAHDRTASGQVVVIQAVPGAEVEVAIDGRSVRARAGVGSVLGPFSLSPGRHQLMFSGAPGGKTIKSMVEVRAGSNSDVVLHRPAAINGAPVVNSYRTPMAAIGPNKARLLLAHTATVAPADVRFDGKTIFTNIANGEFVEADVPSGQHRVALLPSGEQNDPILGPLRVELGARTVTMVYAVGNPKNGSMRAIVHRLRLSADGSAVPRKIDTGSAGLAAGIPVTPFSTPTPSGGQHGPAAPAGQPILLACAAGVVLLVALAQAARRPARSRVGGRSRHGGARRAST